VIVELHHYKVVMHLYVLHVSLQLLELALQLNAHMYQVSDYTDLCLVVNLNDLQSYSINIVVRKGY